MKRITEERKQKLLTVRYGYFHGDPVYLMISGNDFGAVAHHSGNIVVPLAEITPMTPEQYRSLAAAQGLKSN